MLPDFFEFSLFARVVYGPGILKQLGNITASLGTRKALLVSDKVLAKTGVVEKVRKGFADTSIQITALFDEVPPNSTIDTVESCAAMIREKECDCVIAVGGGSVIDTAKVANLLAVKGGRCSEHMGAYLLEKSEKLLTSIYIPTTAGTGSEVTKVAVIADPENDVKLPFTEDQFLPDLAMLDPELTVSMPGKLTAATGMDALTHAIEAYVDKEWSPASDSLALHAIKLISGSILQACAKPENMQARGAMLVGSFLAGVAFSHSMVGMTHGIAHALGGVYHIPHGLANALVLPEVMEYNLDEKADRFADIGLALGLNFPQWVDQSKSILKSGQILSGLVNKILPYPNLKEWFEDKTQLAQDVTGEALEYFRFMDHWMRRQLAQASIDKIRTLNRQLAYLTGMPLNLEEAGVQDQMAKLDLVVQKAMEDGAMLYNPVEPTADAVREILLRVYRARSKPLMVSTSDLKSSTSIDEVEGALDVFPDTDTLYDVLGGFFVELKEHPQIGPTLAATGLCIQFVYQKPHGVITVNATGKELDVVLGSTDLEPEVTMSMKADFAHLFWHGKANLVTALTRRQVRAKGNVPKTLKLLPVLKPAYELYPDFLKKRGLADWILK